MRRTMVMVGVALALSGCDYNRMVAMKEGIESAWAQVDNQLQRRNDLIPSLVQVTKGYATHERDVFEHIADARARMLAGGTRPERIAAATALSTALGQLLAIAERYPDLKANQQFAVLSSELAGTEDSIAAERTRYNDTVREYNAYIKRFPTVLYAGRLGFNGERYFEAPEDSRRVPGVDLGTPPSTASGGA